MRRRLQLTLLAVTVGAASCRTDRAAPARAECTEPGEPIAGEELPEGAVGRFPLDREGCAFLVLSEDAGVRRTANEGRFNGVWRVLFETVERPGLTVEHTDGNHDGRWDKRTVIAAGDAGWTSTETEQFDALGRADHRTRLTPAGPGRMRVTEESRASDGGWQLDEDFETTLRQR